MRYFNIVEDTRYTLSVKPCKDIAKIEDSFVTEDEIRERFPHETYIGDYSRRFVDRALVEAELLKILAPLHNQEMRSVTIDDPELLELLKTGPMSDWVSEVRRAGNRISRWCPKSRKQKAPMKRDINALWMAFGAAYRRKYKDWFPHIPIRLRTVGLAEVYKKAFGWKLVSSTLQDKEQRRWIRMVWNNPKEYL